tara:strand:- start:1192 stop:1377 length:186 start_codon:yes stop_codon:yes gene_type:complete
MAILSKDEYREFTIRVNELVEQGYDLPHTVTTLPEGTFEVKLHGDVDLEELDRLTNSAFAS